LGSTKTKYSIIKDLQNSKAASMQNA